MTQPWIRYCYTMLHMYYIESQSIVCAGSPRIALVTFTGVDVFSKFVPPNQVCIRQNKLRISQEIPLSRHSWCFIVIGWRFLRLCGDAYAAKNTCPCWCHGYVAWRTVVAHCPWTWVMWMKAWFENPNLVSVCVMDFYWCWSLLFCEQKYIALIT